MLELVGVVVEDPELRGRLLLHVLGRAVHRLVGPRVVGRSGLLKVVAPLPALARHPRGQVLLQRLDAPVHHGDGVAVLGPLRAVHGIFGQLPVQRGELVAQVRRDHEVPVVPRQLLCGALGGAAHRLGVLVLQRFHGGLPGEDVHHHQAVLRLPPRVLAEVDEVGLQPVVGPLGGRLAERAGPGRLHLPAHVGLQRLEGHGLRHVEVALPCESVQLPRVPHVEVVGQVPQRLHLRSRFPGRMNTVFFPYLLPQSLSKVPRERGSLLTLLVLRAPLSLSGFKCVQPGLEALAHPPEHAGEVRVVEGDHLRAVAPPRHPRQILPLRSCEVVRGEAQPQVPVHVRALVLLGLHGVKELQELSHVGLGNLRLHPAVGQVREARVADHVARVARDHEAAGVPLVRGQGQLRGEALRLHQRLVVDHDELALVRPAVPLQEDPRALVAQQPQLRAAVGGRAVVGHLQLAPARPVLRQEEIVQEV